MTDLERYLAKLFDAGEQTAAANQLTECAARSLTEVANLRPQWVSINPFKVWRNSKNVGAIRNLVVEYDKGLNLDEQIEHMLQMDFPITTAVYSGNKSIHFVCSLSEPMRLLEEFTEVRRWLDIIFPGADKSMKDPTRFTRAPDAVNAATGKRQELLMLEKRVSPERLASWLARFEGKVAAFDESVARMKPVFDARKERGEISESSWRFLRGEEGVKEGGTRHNRLYAIVCDLCDVVGLPFEEALALAVQCADLQGISSEFGREGEAEQVVEHVYFKRRGGR